jgi:DNA-binding transcriptional regulator PaaX
MRQTDGMTSEATKAAPKQPRSWLVLIYKVPSDPTRLRAAVWRRLKGLGAIYLQNSAAALPLSVSSERALRKLRREILDMSGSAILMKSDMLAGEAEVFEAFQAARDEEYEEIIDKCHDFLAGIDKEFAAEHFSFAELEENEVDHTKLVNWLEKVRLRDVLGAAKRRDTEAALKTCDEALERYAARVYAEEPEGH